MQGNKFFDDKENESKLAWMSWDIMGLSKTNGGLRYIDLECFNIILLAKQ